MANKKTNNNIEFIVMIVAALIIVVPLLFSALVFPSDSEDSKLLLEKPKGEKCIRDTEYMRVNHMDLLKKVRDEVMREGKREVVSEGTRETSELNNCRKCHTSRERFCEKCHSIVGLQLNCYGCHYYPK